MNISILHLSDIHFKNGHNIVLNRADKIFDSIKNEVIGKDVFFIITSGDISFSGSLEEYNIASKFYLDIVDKIRAYTGLESKLLSVPGNHDCLFDKDIEDIRKILIEKFAKDGLSELNENLINLCCEPQKNYFSFRRRIEELTETALSSADHVLDHPLAQVTTYKLGDKIIKFNLFNTSWVSSIKERIGTMKYPIEYMSNRIEQVDSLISISILHHPLNWHTPEYSKTFLDFLLKTSDIIFTGHEHSSQATRRSDLDNEFSTIHIESPALQESEATNSGFNLININAESQELQMLQFDYDNVQHKSYLEIGSRSWKKIDKIKKLKSRDFNLKIDYRQKLEDPGARYTHSNAEIINLKDIFVSPFLQSIDIAKEKSKSQFLHFESSDNILNLNNSPDSKFLKILLGSEYSGKTSILKYYYSVFYEQDYYPVYLAATVINGVDLEKLNKVIAREFSSQYDELDKKFANIDYKNVVLLIDDFHQFTNTKAKVILVKNLQKLFDKIIITGSELMMFESFKDKSGKSIELFENFSWYLIKEFNPSLRNQLITKWYRLGREYMDRDERNEFYKKIDTAEAHIADIIGKNFVPSYPVYVLAILQASEVGDSNGNNNKQHAYYYELLITNSLKRALSDKDDIGFYMTFGKEYFYFLFKEQIRFKPIDIDSFNSVLDNHKREYSISKLNNEQILEVLLKSRILKKDFDNNISPAYKYLYYYFVAKYLADNLDDDNIRNVIDLMADRLYRDEFSNIIVFLIHLARNNYVVQKLIEKSRAIYSEQKLVKLDTDIDFINNLQKSIPEQILRNVEVEEARNQDLENQDKYEEIEVQIEEQSLREDYRLDEDISNLNQIAIITKAVRTIDILGQLTKKYWGELKGEHKYNLAEETFLLGLRVLGFQFSLIDGNVEGLIDHIKKIIAKKMKVDDLSNLEIKSISGNIIFSLCTTATYAILKRIANAIGTEKLSDTFSEIEKKHPYNSVALTNVGIKVDYFSSFPMYDLESIKEANEKNILALVVLRKFLVDYMYMYDLGYEKMQQLCDKFGIKMEEQRLISGTSPIKK